MLTVRKQLLIPDGAPTGRGVRVALLDTGYDANHPDLIGRVNEALSVSFTIRDDLHDSQGHGTHIAGIIGGTGAASNGLLRGLAPECELVVFRIAGGSHGAESRTIEAVEAAVEIGADIINYSHGHVPRGRAGDPPWVWPAELSMVEQAFEVAEAKGVLCIVAAGNEGPDGGSVTRPGGIDCVLTVGAIDSSGKVLDISSRGPYRRLASQRDVTRYDPAISEREIVTIAKPDIVAPGVITAPRRVGQMIEDESPETIELNDAYYVELRGSSQATAVVSGLAAMLLDVVRSESIDLGPNPARTLRKLLKKSAGSLEGHTASESGAGLVIWPTLAGHLEDFTSDPQFREVILFDSSLRLL